MNLFRRSMRPPRNLQPQPEFMEQVHDIIKGNTHEQNAAIVRAIHEAEAATNRKLEKIMHTLEETLDLVEAQNTRVDSLIALTADLHQKVLDAIGSGLTPSQQMRIDAVFDEVKTEADKVDAAITANTVAASAGAISDGPSAKDIKASIADPSANPEQGSAGQSSQT